MRTLREDLSDASDIPPSPLNGVRGGNIKCVGTCKRRGCHHPSPSIPLPVEGRGRFVTPSQWNRFLRSTLPWFALLVVTMATTTRAATIVEDFSTDPLTDGWKIFGATNLFHWNTTNQNLEVTWDSSQTNSYFYHSLGTTLARDDDFSFAFDLRMHDIAVGVNTNKPFTFQLAIVLINLEQATRTNFLRGTGMDSPNLVEFDYFPDSGFGATVSPTIISSNHQFATTFNFPLELTIEDLFHVAMSYTASNGTLVTTMTRNGQSFGPIQEVDLGAAFTDFRVDSIAILSYNDAGQDPQFGGSILACGVVDNLTVTTPASPVGNLTANFTNAVWQV